MSEPNTQFETASDASVAALQEEVQSLRTLLVGLLLVVILFSGSLNIYLREQSFTVARQAAEARKFVDDYKNVGEPSARDLWFKLNQYAKAHPDFNPIIAKYSQYITTSGPTGTVQKR